MMLGTHYSFFAINMHIFSRLLLLSLLLPAIAMADPLPALQRGDTWRYQQFESVGDKRIQGPAIDMRVAYPTTGNQWMLAKFVGPTSYAQLKRSGQIPIVGPGPLIPSPSCLIDVITGNDIASGRGCEKALTLGERWSIQERNTKSLVNVDVQAEGLEPVLVPAGNFNAHRLKVVIVDTSLGAESGTTPAKYTEINYWYAEVVRGMVRIERRFFDSQRTHTHSVVQELADFENL